MKTAALILAISLSAAAQDCDCKKDVFGEWTSLGDETISTSDPWVAFDLADYTILATGEVCGRLEIETYASGTTRYMAYLHAFTYSTTWTTKKAAKLWIESQCKKEPLKVP